MAKALAAAGADLAVTSRTTPELESLCDELKPLGRRTFAVKSDITDPASCEQMVEIVVRTLGRVDVLVNNAGVNVRKPILEIPLEEYDQVLNTNLKGYLHCARAAGRRMVAQGSGKVINISSILGTVALANQGRALTRAPRARSNN
jgi:NAD(P)-dependent dehydrogenase (short-subunit alcohol dehydrogenase family)